MTGRVRDSGGITCVCAGVAAVLVGVVTVFGVVACAGPDTEPDRLAAVALGTLPQQENAFVEGLATMPDGTLVESTGSYTEPSTLRILDPGTGAVLRERLVAGVFGEGVAVRVADNGTATIWMLTWREHVVIRFSADLVELSRTPLVGGNGEGWGVCTAGAGTLISSDGSATLVRRDAATFAPLSTLAVRMGGAPVSGLNELECGGDGVIWANRFPTETLLRIDSATGRVTGSVDLTSLAATERTSTDPNAVANGVAVLPDGTAWLTGKWWRHLVHVRLVPAASGSGGGR